MDDRNRDDSALRKEAQFAALKHDVQKYAVPLKDLVLGEIRNGTRPEWIAQKYSHLGVTLERVLRAKEAIDAKNER